MMILWWEMMCLQAMDLRWGIREQSHDDHTIIEFCMREIENCKRTSVGPTFVVSPASLLNNNNIIIIIIITLLLKIIIMMMIMIIETDNPLNNRKYSNLYVSGVVRGTSAGNDRFPNFLELLRFFPLLKLNNASESLSLSEYYEKNYWDYLVVSKCPRQAVLTHLTL